MKDLSNQKISPSTHGKQQWGLSTLMIQRYHASLVNQWKYYSLEEIRFVVQGKH